MPPETESTADIDRALRVLREQRPGWEELLDFHGGMIRAQRRALGRTRIAPLELDEQMLALKAREAMPLVALDQFVVNVPAAAALLDEICRLATPGNPDLRAVAAGIQAALSDGRVRAAELFNAVVCDNGGTLSRLARSMAVNDRALSFFAYNSIKPSVELCARQLEDYLDPDQDWENGYCPVCGTAPVISILGASGERQLVCGFCWHHWRTRRLACPFCGNSDAKTLSYFFSDSEKDCRVYVCDACRKYLKSVDSREIRRPLIPELEHMATLHFDVKALEMGYESGIDLHLAI